MIWREKTLKLQLGFIDIEDVRPGDETRIEKGTLYINTQEALRYILEDEDVRAWVRDAHFEIARPGESVRVTPVKDVIQPRVKAEGSGGQFPGVISGVETVGSGRTHVLRGMAVITVGPIVGFQEGIIDMSGPGAEYTEFSRLVNLVLVCEPVDGAKPHEYERAVRLAGLRAAVYAGEAGRNAQPDEVKTYETCGVKVGMEGYPGLPRVGYVHMLQSQGLLHDTYVYGVDAKQMLPTILFPTETMDGAIISGNCVSACDKNTTYHHQNNPVVAELFEEHGSTLNYVCNIITNENVYLADKVRSSDWTAKLCALMELDGVIISQEGFGNPDADLIMNTRKIERMGIKTAIITDEYAGRDGASQSLADSDPLADAVVTGGNANQVIVLPRMDRVIGTLDHVDRIAGGHAGSLREDGSIEAEIQVITGATNEMGFGRLSAR